MRILLAEDEETIAITLRDALEDAGHTVLAAADTDAALAVLDSDSPDVVLTDIRMPGDGGMAVLKRSIDLDEGRPVIVMTGYGTIDQAVDAMRIGAASYVQKPFSNTALVMMIERFARSKALEIQNEDLRRKVREMETTWFPEMIGRSAAMLEVFDRIRTVAPSDATVLIEGESGTGKERAANAVHASSARAEGPFVPLSCAALPETLLEAELFGHEKGAFTDAHKSKRGRFEMADGGTIFLDDIDDMPGAVQVKLLRVLQERSLERVGGEASISVDIRVVAATKIPLKDLVREGSFREDLFYRINVVPLRLPPLRERGGDVPLLLQHMIEKHGKGTPFTISAAALAACERYPWPGNVRELENAVQRAIALAGGGNDLRREDLLPVDPRWRGATEVDEAISPLKEVVRDAERSQIQRALAATGGHRTQTAELLGISRKVLWEKIKALGIQAPEGH